MFYVIKTTDGFHSGVSPTGRKLTVPTLEGAAILSEADAKEMVRDVLTGAVALPISVQEPAAPAVVKEMQDKLHDLGVPVSEVEAAACCHELGIESSEDIMLMWPQAMNWIDTNRSAMYDAARAVADALKEYELQAETSSIRDALMRDGTGAAMFYMGKVPDTCAFLMSQAKIH